MCRVGNPQSCAYISDIAFVFVYRGASCCNLTLQKQLYQHKKFIPLPYQVGRGIHTSLCQIRSNHVQWLWHHCLIPNSLLTYGLALRLLIFYMLACNLRYLAKSAVKVSRSAAWSFWQRQLQPICIFFDTQYDIVIEKCTFWSTRGAFLQELKGKSSRL